MYGEPFCGNCGMRLNWPNQTAQPPNPPYGGTTPNFPPNPQWNQAANNQQQGWGQPPNWNQNPQFNQPPQWGGPPQYQTAQYPQNSAANKGSGGLIALVLVIIFGLFAVGGIGLATGGDFSKFLVFMGIQAAPAAVNQTPTQNPQITPPATTQPPAITTQTPTETPIQTPTETPTETPTQTLTPTTTTPPVQYPNITAGALITAYQADDVNAGITYGGKIYNITGVITGYNDYGTPAWVLLSENNTGLMSLQCDFQATRSSEVTALNTDPQALGKKVTIQGKVNTWKMEGFINIAQCKFVQ
jgi:hypothetical protein